MENKVKEIDFHITDYCNGHCPMCYATEEGMTRSHGDLETLKLIVHNAIMNGEVERFVMVGGDPCEHPQLIELLKYIKEEGKTYGVKTTTIVLSNTHDYKENGKPVDIKDVVDYIDEMDITIHGSTADIHDAFNGVPGSYEHVIANAKKFAELKGDSQAVSAVINLMPQTVDHMSEIMLKTALKFDGKLKNFVIQRIAPSGRAAGEVKYFIEKQDVNPILKIFHEMIQNNGFNIEFCDVLPWCSVKEEYRYMLPVGGCNWGTEVCAVEMDGTVKRCAMASNPLLSKMTELDTKEKWQRFWDTEPELIAFRKKAHLDERCRVCKMLEQCGGACVMARTDGDPYQNENKLLNKIDPQTGTIKSEYLIDGYAEPEQGHDYLRR